MAQLESILLVDDDEITNHLHENVIRKSNIARQAFSKTDCTNALKFIEKQYYSLRSLPSLILLDLHVPGLNGFDFINQIMESELLSVKNIPIAIVTNSESPKDMAKIRELGRYSLVNKPLTKEKLMKIVDNLSSSMAFQYPQD